MRDTTTRPGFTLILESRPAYDRRDPNPARNYGIGSVTLHFTLVGPKGAVSWQLLTGWMPTSVLAERFGMVSSTGKAYAHLARGSAADAFGHSLPDAGEVAWHHPEPHRLGAEPQKCPYLPAGLCYNDVGYTAGEAILEGLLKGGVTAVWDLLAEHYRHTFEPAPRALDVAVV